MSEHAAIDGSAGYRDVAATIRTRDNFYLYMSVVLLAILLAGFIPTLYLRFFSMCRQYLFICMCTAQLSRAGSYGLFLK